MHNYPLTFTFAPFSVTPQIEAKDSAGRVVLNASKKLISSKEEIAVTSGGQPVCKIVSQESRITDIPSNWDIILPNGQVLGIVDDDFVSAVDTSSFIENRGVGMIVEHRLERALNLKALKMHWLKSPAGAKVGLIAPEKNSLMAQQIPLYDIVRQLPLFFRFINAHYYIRLGDQTVMQLQKKRTWFIDTYVLEARGQFNAQDEQLLVYSVVLALLYERQQLKDLFEA